MFFYRQFKKSPFYCSMRANDTAGTETVSWFVEAECLSQPVPRRMPSRATLVEARATSKRVVIASSLFLVLLGAALLIGGHAAIHPLLKTAMASREAKGVGDVVYAMPDGIFCRHIAFDNATADVTESALERCPSDIARNRVHSGPTFAWGSR